MSDIKATDRDTDNVIELTDIIQIGSLNSQEESLDAEEIFEKKNSFENRVVKEDEVDSLVNKENEVDTFVNEKGDELSVESSDLLEQNIIEKDVDMAENLDDAPSIVQNLLADAVDDFQSGESQNAFIEELKENINLLSQDVDRLEQGFMSFEQGHMEIEDLQREIEELKESNRKTYEYITELQENFDSIVSRMVAQVIREEIIPLLNKE